MLRSALKTCLWNGLTVMLLAVAGCGAGTGLEGETGTVSGKASYKGQPVPGGASVVMMHKEKGYPATGLIDGAGNFKMEMRGAPNLLVGEYLVSISPPESAKSQAEDMTAPAAGKPVEWDGVPVKYQTPETSGQTFTVKAGANDLQLDLKE